MDYVDIHGLHEKYCPKKVLSNFWRSDGYKAAEAVLKGNELEARYNKEMPAQGRKAVVMVHPLVVLEFLRWANPEFGQLRIFRLLEMVHTAALRTEAQESQALAAEGT